MMKLLLSIAWTCTFLAAIAPRYASSFAPKHDAVFARNKIISRPFGRALASWSDHFNDPHIKPFGRSSLPHVNEESLETASYFNDEESLETASYFNDDMLKSAYGGWRAKYSKNFDPLGFKNFKSNYLTIMDANIAAKQAALEVGKESPRWITLNEYGDLSLDEYKVVLGALGKAKGDTLQASTNQGKKILDKQNDDWDESEGKWEDESEGRWDPIRRIYSDWCKQFGQEPDESRYPTFSTNFLALAQHCSNTGSEIDLNKYADCTQGEYLELTGGDSEEIGKYGIPASWSILLRLTCKF
jgi:hypothetical protein